MMAERGAGPSGPGGAIRLVFPAEPFEVRAALSRLLDALPGEGVCPDLRSSIMIVVAEVLNNVVEHAYEEQEGVVEMTLFPVTGGFRFEISDQGHPMPNGRLPPAGLPANTADGMPEGGFGWYLIHSLAQDIRYDRIGAVNRLGFLLLDQAPLAVETRPYE